METHWGWEEGAGEGEGQVLEATPMLIRGWDESCLGQAGLGWALFPPGA